MSQSTVRVAWTLATWFGCGLAGWAPGTMGTLGAIPIYLVASRFGWGGTSVAAVAVTGAGIWAAGVVARGMHGKDPQVVVVDEVAGFLVTMLGVRSFSWSAVAIGFAVFRLLDITKPWPVRKFEALPGGWGIVLDDVAAGIAGALAMGLVGATWGFA